MGATERVEKADELVIKINDLIDEAIEELQFISDKFLEIHQSMSYCPEGFSKIESLEEETIYLHNSLEEILIASAR